jgi:uncharacterized membrane protein
MTGGDTAPRVWARMTPARWLLVAVVTYFAVAFALSWLRAFEFQTTTWDQGLYQQALWTTGHGRMFYETADVETGGYGSLLEVHSVFVLYLLVPLYAVLPYQATMLAVQAAVVAVAAIPLYLLARDVTGSARMALVAGIVYLCWTPTLSSNLYDFHPEAFLPLEVFALVLLWNRGRFLAGFGVAVVAFLTFEFTPLIVAAIAIVAMLPTTVSSRAGFAAWLRGLFGHPGPTLRAALSDARVRASLLLLLASAIAYAGLLVVRVDLLPSIVGSTMLPAPATGYVIGATPAALGLSLPNLEVGFESKVAYWVLILGLLAFVPLLAPRALLLTVPWFLFTLFSANLNYVTLGFQYGLIAGSTVMVAFVFALPRARRLLDVRLVPEGAAAADRDPPRRPVRAPRAVRIALVASVGLLLALNVALTPVDPALQNSGLGSAYRLSYDPAAGSGAVIDLAAVVPASATVLASDDLFPLVANDAHAYSFLWEADGTLYLPFTPDDPPTYVLLAEDRTAAVTDWLQGVLYNSSVYGVRGIVWSSPVGAVLLFEAGFRGAPTVFGPAPVPVGAYYGSPIADGPAGFATTYPGSTYPNVVESAPGADGTVWYGPGVSLAPGNYTVTVSVRASPIPGFPPPASAGSVLWIGASAFAQDSMFGSSYSYGSIDAAGFTPITFVVDVTSPTIEFDVQGQLLVSNVELVLNYVAVAGP